MSLALDQKALTDRFDARWPSDVVTLIANGGETPMPKNQPYVRFSVIPSGRKIIASNDLAEQQGRVWLQVFIPTGHGTARAAELADLFVGIFPQGWRSPDRCVMTHEFSQTTSPVSENGFYQLNTSIRWTSIRRI